MRRARSAHRIIAAVFAFLVVGCNQDTVPASAQDTGIVRPNALTAEQAMDLSEKIKLRGGPRDLINILRFTHYYKRGQRDPAFVALELVTHKLAKAIVASARERQALAAQGIDIDLEEGLELRQEIERQQRMTECEREVASGGVPSRTWLEFGVTRSPVT